MPSAPSALVLRAAGPRDAPAIASMANALAVITRAGPGLMTPERVTADLIDGPGEPACMVAEHDGRIVAYALYQSAYESAYAVRGIYVSDLFVDAAARGQGIGRALLAELAARAERAGGSFLWWVSDAHNEAANAVYHRLGAARYSTLAWALFEGPFEALGDRR